MRGEHKIRMSEKKVLKNEHTTTERRFSVYSTTYGHSNEKSVLLSPNHTPFGFGEYAETVGPQGLLFVLKGKTPVWRKSMWTCIIIIGVIYSSYNIKLCADRFYSYPSTIKPAKNFSGLVRFPKITACLNSMHSLRKMEAKYPWVIPYLPNLYTGQHFGGMAPTADQSSSNTSAPDDHYIQLDKRFAELNMTEFYKNTVPEVYLPYCEFHRQDCKHEWKFKFTFYGYCLEFNNDTTRDPKPKISVGRQTSLSFLFGYNDTDWTNGWMAAFDGFTVFYSEPNEQTIDPLFSIALSSASVPMLSVKQTMTKLLGHPYGSQCLRDGVKLKYFSHYTDKHCYHECSVEKIAKECGCKAPFFPEDMDYPICSFHTQSVCIAPRVVGFDYDACISPENDKSCFPECHSVRHIADSFQNAIYRRSTNGVGDMNGMKTSTMVIYMTEVEEVCYTEVAEYGIENFLSDVGGTAGLILGMSFATVIGLVDILIQKAITYLRMIPTIYSLLNTPVTRTPKIKKVATQTEKVLNTSARERCI